MVVDLEDGEDVVVEEALLGRYTFTRSRFWALSQRATFGRYAGLYTPAKKGPSYQKEVRQLTKASWPNFVPRAASRLFSQSENTFTDDVIARMLNY